MMKRQQLESSNIADAGYDADSGAMEITFRNGRRYRYCDVPQNLFDEFMRADSAGRFFASMIRGSFESERADNDEESSDER
jgi:hypothetical protein